MSKALDDLKRRLASFDDTGECEWSNYSAIASDAIAHAEDLRELVRELVAGLRAQLDASDQLQIAINNNVFMRGHASIVLRKHPMPCCGLDFCAVKDAKRRMRDAEAVTNANDALLARAKGGCR